MWCLHYIAELRQKKRKFSASTEITVDLARNAVLGNLKNVAGPLCDLKKAIRQIQFQVRRTLGMDSTKKPIVTAEIQDQGWQRCPWRSHERVRKKKTLLKTSESNFLWSLPNVPGRHS